MARKIKSPPLTREEIRDVKAARKSRDWKTYPDYKEFLEEIQKIMDEAPDLYKALEKDKFD